MRIILLATMVASITIAAAMIAAADEQTAPGAQAGPDIKYKVNLVMDDGTVIFYAGAKQGVKTGDEYALYRGNQQVGTVKVSRVTDLAAYCRITSGDAKEMDGLAQTKTGATATSGPKTTEKTPEEIAAEKAKKDEDAKKKKEAAERKKQEDAEKKKKQEEAEKAKADAAEKAPPAEKKKPAEKKPPAPKYEELTSPAPTYYGSAGLIYMPTAEAIPANKGMLQLHMTNASDKSLDYKDNGYGVTFGAGRNMDVSVTRISTKVGSTTGGYSLNSNFISVKYVVKQAGGKPGKPNKPVKARAGGIDYAAGASYYKTTVSTAFAGKASAKANRIYLVGTSDYDKMKLHAGIYTQNGNLVSNTKYAGFGYMAGFEYPLGGAGLTSGLSLIGEYDDKAYYLETLRTPSVGLRYNGGAYSVTLAVLDVTKTKIFSLGGSYGF